MDDSRRYIVVVATVAGITFMIKMMDHRLQATGMTTYAKEGVVVGGRAAATAKDEGVTRATTGSGHHPHHKKCRRGLGVDQETNISTQDPTPPNTPAASNGVTEGGGDLRPLIEGTVIGESGNEWKRRKTTPSLKRVGVR